MIDSSELHECLGPSGDCQKLKRAIQEDVSVYVRGRSELGRSMPVALRTTHELRVIESHHIVNLCSWYLNGDIDEVELEYIANMVDLSPDLTYSNESIAESTRDLADPEINGVISRDKVGSIVARLMNMR